MKPLLYNHHCENCDKTFKAPELPERYGEFILHSNDINDSVYLNAFEDQVFNEVKELYKKNENVKKKNKLSDTKLFQSIFSISCDLAADGSQYQIGFIEICPNCSSGSITSWSPTDPPEFLSEDIKSVTHNLWNKLSEEKKVDLINKSVINHLKIDQKKKISRLF